MNNWEKEYNKMAELNEFFGLPYNKHTDNLIKDFLFTSIQEAIAEERKMVVRKIKKRRKNNLDDEEVIYNQALEDIIIQHHLLPPK